MDLNFHFWISAPNFEFQLVLLSFQLVTRVVPYHVISVVQNIMNIKTPSILMSSLVAYLTFVQDHNFSDYRKLWAELWALIFNSWEIVNTVPLRTHSSNSDYLNFVNFILVFKDLETWAFPKFMWKIFLNVMEKMYEPIIISIRYLISDTGKHIRKNKMRERMKTWDNFKTENLENLRQRVRKCLATKY